METAISIRALLFTVSMVIKMSEKRSLVVEKNMGRPRKSPDLLMNLPLRILLTAEQKALIEEAARLNQSDVAAWARPILLDEARSMIAKSQAGKKQKK